MEERFIGGAYRATPPTPASIGSSVPTAMKKVTMQFSSKYHYGFRTGQMWRSKVGCDLA